MKNNLLLCIIFFACASVVGIVQSSETKKVGCDISTVTLSDTSGSASNISLPNSAEVKVVISDISGSTVNVFIHPSNKIIHFHVHDLSGSNVYLYGTNTPQITSLIHDISGSSVDLEKIMHPARQYTYHAVAGVAILGLLHYSRK